MGPAEIWVQVLGVLQDEEDGGDIVTRFETIWLELLPQAVPVVTVASTS